MFALQLVERVPLSDVEAARSAIEAALAFGRGPAPSLSGFHNGADAWRATQAALASGRVDPAGLAYAAQRWAESRAAAAAWLGRVPLGVDLSAAQRGFGRAAAMLAELATLPSISPPPGAMLTNTARDQAAELVLAAAHAEAGGLDALGAALTALERQSVSALALVDLTDERLPDLFACVRELPLALDEEAQLCRERGRLYGKLLYDGARLVAHLLWAPLEEALQPIVADGRRWFVFCPWVAHERRGRGAGPRLFAALESAARAAGVDGLVTFATDDQRFLYVESFARLGFVEAARRGELHLLERALSDTPSRARFAEVADAGARVTVRHAYHCPLLLRARREAAAAAREAGVTLDEADARPDQPAGARLDGHDLPHGFLPAAALVAHLRASRS